MAIPALSRRRFTSLLFLAAASFLPATPAFSQDKLPTGLNRIVSIGGTVTEIIHALGEEGRLIARDSSSTYPPAALSLPDVGYMRALSPEGVLSVNPGAIIAIEGSGPKPVFDVLAKAAIPVVMIPNHYDRRGMETKIRMIGQVLGVEAKADILARQAGADLEAAIALHASLAPGKRQRVLFILSAQDGKIMAAGNQTAASALIELAGGINALPTMTGYRPVSDEAIIEASPDVILMMDRQGSHAMGDDALLSHPAIARTPAGQGARIIRMDGLQMLGFGPRTAKAVRLLGAALHDGPKQGG